MPRPNALTIGLVLGFGFLLLQHFFPPQPAGMAEPSLKYLPPYVQATTPVVTIRLTGRETSSGFFFRSDGQVILITHGFAIRDAEKIQIVVHADPNNLKSETILDVALWKPDGRSAFRRLVVGSIQSFELIAVDLDQKIFRDGNHHYMAFDPTNIIGGSDSINMGQDILEVCYPGGLYDQVYNLPLVRGGIVATQSGFNNIPCFIVDVNFMQGSAGSPLISRSGPHRLLGVVVDNHFLSGSNGGLTVAVNADQILKLVKEGVRVVRTSTLSR